MRKETSQQKIIHNFHEQKAWSSNRLTCGVDEVGRGCLAGPVVVSSVILFPNKKSHLLKDSKELSKGQLNRAYSWIINNCWYSYSVINNRIVDKKNIYKTTLCAMKRATLQLLASSRKQPQTILVDAMPLSLANTPYDNIEIKYFPFGESVSSSIAAASIIAKVKRDKIMKKLDMVFPGYALELHKGYQTNKHINALDIYGSSIIHRNTYLKNYFQSKKEVYEKQQSMFC